MAAVLRKKKYYFAFQKPTLQSVLDELVKLKKYQKLQEMMHKAQCEYKTLRWLEKKKKKTLLSSMQFIRSQQSWKEITNGLFALFDAQTPENKNRLL